MIKSLALAALLAGLALSPRNAGPIEDSIVRQLRDQGFAQIEVRRTLLGRSRIVAQSGTLYREIIVNPATGEILRDFWRPLDGRNGAATIYDPTRGGGQGVERDDDDDTDDDDDDDDDDDGDDGGDDGGDNGGDGDGGDGDGGDDD